LFKNTSTHRVLLDTSPFPVVPIQKGTGAAGRWSFCVADGVIYFVTPGKRMRATTDGASFADFPNYIDDVWDSINSARVPYIQGFYYEKLNQIHWLVSTGSATTNNYSIIWDLRRKAWLRHTTGYDANVTALVQGRDFYCGHYDGKIYKKDVASTYTDASETSPGAIDAFWQTGWIPGKGASDVIHPRWIDTVVAGQGVATNYDISYGFDFSSNTKSESQSQQSLGSLWGNFQWGAGVWGGSTSRINRTMLYGRGNVFQARFRNRNASEAFQFQGATLYLRPVAQRKLLNVS